MSSAVACRLCIGDIAVPLAAEEREVFAGGPPEEFLVLSLAKRTPGGRADFGFLEKALGLSSRSFLRTQWPLLIEIYQAISDFKQEMLNVSKRASRRQNVVVEVVVRGHRLRVLNSLHCVRLYWEKKDQVEEMQWLLDELRKDLDKIDESFKTKVLLKKKISGLDDEIETPEKKSKRPREDLEGGTPGGASVASAATEVAEEAAEEMDDTAS